MAPDDPAPLAAALLDLSAVRPRRGPMRNRCLARRYPNAMVHPGFAAGIFRVDVRSRRLARLPLELVEMFAGAQLLQIELMLECVEHAVVDGARAVEADELGAAGGDRRQDDREMLPLSRGQFL
jgi:hypothetical protein